MQYHLEFKTAIQLKPLHITNRVDVTRNISEKNNNKKEKEIYL